MDLPLIPALRSIEAREGTFNPTVPALRIVCGDDDESVWTAINRLAEEIGRMAGRSIDINPGKAGNDLPEIVIQSGANIHSEEYTLDIGTCRILIEGQGSGGTFYGIQTLRQIMRSTGTNLPCCRITDGPHFVMRGFYHDVTRGKVPTLATLKSLADALAYYKINHLQLYVEHTFAFSHLPELWSGKDPLTADEIRELDEYCRQRRIDLVPSLATFGHLYELLRIKRFEHLNELDIRASELPHSLWDRMAHYTIDVSQEESFLLIQSMLDEYLPLFSSRFANICCDETFDLGKGKNRDRAQEIGIGPLYASFVTRLCDVVRSYDKIPMLWGDIVLHHPEVISKFPEDTVFLNWAYGADVTPEATETFYRAGVRQVVCPGVQGWSRFASDITGASSNIRRMAAYGKQYGAMGMLTTDWGDCGHVNFLASSYHGMALGAALSWDPKSYADDSGFDRAISFLQWGDRSGEIAILLRELGSLCFFHFGNLYAMVNKLDCPWNREQEVRDSDPELLYRNHARATAIADRFRQLSAKPEFASCAQDLREFIWSAEAVSWTLALLAWVKRERFGQKECGELYGNNEKLATQGA
ncbi:MAG: family 20 glycosylhydrolase, partial [Chitinispirillaceae bacterium]|nr:family 20 glycosylhydrolase [Chitinispirillaceae bacterium]